MAFYLISAAGNHYGRSYLDPLEYTDPPLVLGRSVRVGRWTGPGPRGPSAQRRVCGAVPLRASTPHGTCESAMNAASSPLKSSANEA
jgi:hypothetical protein